MTRQTSLCGVSESAVPCLFSSAISKIPFFSRCATSPVRCLPFRIPFVYELMLRGNKILTPMESVCWTCSNDAGYTRHAASSDVRKGGKSPSVFSLQADDGMQAVRVMNQHHEDALASRGCGGRIRVGAWIRSCGTRTSTSTENPTAPRSHRARPPRPRS